MKSGRQSVTSLFVLSIHATITITWSFHARSKHAVRMDHFKHVKICPKTEADTPGHIT